LLGHLPEKVMEHFGNGSKFGISIKYSIGDVSFETGTRIKKAEDLLDDYFLLMYCDNYWPLDIQKLIKFHNKHKALATVTVYTNKDAMTRNNVFVDISGYLTKYDKARKIKNLNGVEIGFFIINKKILKLMPDTNFSFEQWIIPQLIEKKQICGYLTDNKYHSISTIERLKLTEKFFSKNLAR
jgi:D-glycero-D-manno-heptose 1,7-bisphosphate phosphatase